MMRGVLLKMYFGSSLDVPGDALVNAANERLDHGGGLAGQILKKAGDGLQEESRIWVSNNGTVPSGGVAVTGSYDLKNFKCIIHAVGPKDRDSYENRDMLISTVVQSIKQAAFMHLTSINIPGLSCGIFGFPKDVSAECHIQAYQIFALQSHLYPSMKTINLCLFTLEEVKLFAEQLIKQSDNFDVFEYYGSPEEQSLSFNNTMCSLCHESKNLSFFSITQFCCRKVCNDCHLKNGLDYCISCSTRLNNQHYG
jgi:O-acetyl-ADP-ribose deacetylase